MFVSYSYPRFYDKLNASLFDLHGPSFVSSILYVYKSAFMDLYQYLNHGAILLMALGGASVSFGHISSFLSFFFCVHLGMPNCQNKKPKWPNARIILTQSWPDCIHRFLRYCHRVFAVVSNCLWRPS